MTGSTVVWWTKFYTKCIVVIVAKYWSADTWFELT